MLTLSKRRPATISIDGHPITLAIKRLGLEEAESFRQAMRRLLGDDERVLVGDDAAFVRASIESYVTVRAGELQVDGVDIVTGGQLLDIIGEMPGVVTRTLLAILGVTTPSESEGKPSASESVSVPSSDASAPAPDGPRPEPTADGVALAGTASNADVTVETDPPSCGSTEKSN